MPKAHLKRPQGHRWHVVVARRTNVPDDLAMDGARDTVLQLQVHLWDRVFLEDGSV